MYFSLRRPLLPFCDTTRPAAAEGGRFDMDFGFFASEAKWFGRWDTKSGARRGLPVAGCHVVCCCRVLLLGTKPGAPACRVPSCARCRFAAVPSAGLTGKPCCCLDSWACGRKAAAMRMACSCPSQPAPQTLHGRGAAWRSCCPAASLAAWPVRSSLCCPCCHPSVICWLPCRAGRAAQPSAHHPPPTHHGQAVPLAHIAWHPATSPSAQCPCCCLLSCFICRVNREAHDAPQHRPRTPCPADIRLSHNRVLAGSLSGTAEFAEKRKTYSFFLLTDDLAVANSSGGPKTLMYRVK